MKKFYMISAAVLCLVAAASCTQETPAPDAVKTVLRASLEPTKSALGAYDDVNHCYPNYWKQGDQISVNGETSEALGNEDDGKTTVDFTIPGAVAAPYYAAYPVSAVSGYDAGSATLAFPATQSYVAGSYDPAAYLLCGKSTVVGKVSLKPQVSIIHLTVNGSGASINKIQLTSESGLPMSGTFTTDFENAPVPGTGNVSSTVEMVPASAVALPAEFFICVPAGLESTLTVKLFDTEGKAMTLRANLKSALAAGQVYSPDAFSYSGAALPSFDITAEGVTSSTAVICLPDAAYASSALTFNVYSDANCSTLVDSYAVDADNECWGDPAAAPRFCISGLAAGTTYFVTVEDVTNTSISGVLPVTTRAFTNIEVSSTPAAVNDVILAEDFGELRWDSELITSGVGYFATSQDSFANSEVLQFLPIDTNSEKTLGSQTTALSGSRLEHWAQGANNNLYIHPGYLKLVGNKKVTHLVTPALDNIPDGKLATLEVEVTACPYYSGSSAAYATMNAIVAVQPAGSYNELGDDPNTNTLDLSTNIQPITLDAETAWKTYKVTLTGVGKGARLAFGAAADVTENSARMNISDMKVTLKALEDLSLTASVKAVSSSTAAFTWTYGGDATDDIAKAYTASLYSDAACTNLVVSHHFEASASCWDGKIPCFSFGGLAPSTTYWLVVEDTDNGTVSDPVSATTEAFEPVDATTVSNAAVGDVILAEDFSEIGWGPDEFAGAAGFIPSPKNLNAPSGVNPAGAYTTYSNTGQRIFGTGVDLGSSRLSKGWGFFGNSAAYLRNAYLRVATTADPSRTHIVTPKLSGIPAGKLATIDVTVTATKHESNTNDVAVFVSDKCEMNSQTNPGESNYHKYSIDGSATALPNNGTALGITSVKTWESKTVSISGVDSDCQLIIGSFEDITGKNRFSITDVKVTITALIDDPVMKIYDNATFQAFVDAVAVDKTVDAKVTASFTVSTATADAFASIEDYEGTLNGNGKTITGLTKPLFNNLKGTVKDLTLNSTLNITADQLNLGILANVLSGTADGCTSQGSVTFNVAGGVTGEHHIAGMFGQALEGSSITGCTNEASVTNYTSYADGNSSELMVGGVLGTFWGVDFTISDCENTGAVINNGAWNKDVSVGGVIGQAGNSSSLTCTMTVSGCTNSGPVTNNGETNDATNSVGGVIGWIRFGTYTDNSNTGAVTNTGNAKQNRVGGLIGYLDKNATFDDNSNSGDVSNTGVATDINYVGGLLGRMQTGSTFLNNSNSGAVSNSGDATNYVYMGGIVGYMDKENKISDAGSSAQYKLTNSGDIENGGSAKNICIGGLFGRNSTGYFNMTGTSSKYSTNSGNITDNSGPAKSNGGDLSIGGIAGYTTTGIKTQYARNSGDIYVTGDKGSTSVNVGGIGGWISNNAFNFNNCRNTGDITVDATTTASIWAAGIVACPKPNTTNHYYWRSNATIDTHLATVGGENYTAGLMATVEGSDASSTFTMTGHRLAGTVWGSTTTTGLFCCTKNNTASFSIKKGDASNPCMIAPGTVRKDNTHDDTINDINDVTIDVLAGGAGSTYDITSVIADEHITVTSW